MIQLMKAAIGSTSGNTSVARHAMHHEAWMLRRAVGVAIVTSGLAVIAAQALQYALGG
jgi:hypothetical protein